MKLQQNTWQSLSQKRVYPDRLRWYYHRLTNGEDGKIKMFKIAILQKRAINARIDKNIESIIMAMKEASENHADILLLPECFVTGYALPMSYEKSISDDDMRIAQICENAKKY